MTNTLNDMYSGQRAKPLTGLANWFPPVVGLAPDPAVFSLRAPGSPRLTKNRRGRALDGASQAPPSSRRPDLGHHRRRQRGGTGSTSPLPHGTGHAARPAPGGTGEPTSPALQAGGNHPPTPDRFAPTGAVRPHHRTPLTETLPQRAGCPQRPVSTRTGIQLSPIRQTPQRPRFAPFRRCPAFSDPFAVSTKAHSVPCPFRETDQTRGRTSVSIPHFTESDAGYILKPLTRERTLSLLIPQP